MSVGEGVGGIKNISDFFANIPLWVEEKLPNLNNLVVGVRDATGGVGKLKAAFSGLWGVVKAHPIITVIAASTTLITIIKNISQQEQKIIEKSEEAASKIKEIEDEFNNKSTKVDELGEKFAELSEGVNLLTGKNISLSDEEYKEFLSISNELAELFPTLTRNYDANGNAIIQLSGGVDTVVSNLKDLLEVERHLANQKILEEMPKLYEGDYTKYNQQKRELDDYNKSLNYYESLKEQKVSVIDANNANDLALHGGRVLMSNDAAPEFKKLLREKGYDLDFLENYTSDGKNTYITLEGLDNYSHDDSDIQQFEEAINAGLNLFGSAQEEINKLKKDISIKENEIKQTWSKVAQRLITWASEDDSYALLNDDMQSVVQRMISGLDFSTLNNGKPFDNIEDLEEYIRENIISTISELTPEAQTELANMLKIDPKSVSFEDYKKTIEEISKKTADASDGKFDSSQIQKMFGFDEMLDGYDEKIKEVQSKIDKQVTKAVIRSTLSTQDIDKALEYLKSHTEATWDEIKDYVNSENVLNSFSKPLEETIEGLEGVISAFDTVKNAIKDYNENGYISVSNLKELISLDDTYLNALTNEQGALDLSAEKYKKLVEAKRAEMKASLLRESLNNVADITTEEAALKYLGETQNEVAQSALDLAEAKWNEAMATAAARDAEQGTGNLYQQTIIATRQAYETKTSLIDSYFDSLGDLTSATEGHKEALEQEQKALEKSKSALEDKKDALEKTKKGYEDAIDSVKDLVEWVEKYIQQTKKDEIEALEKKRDAFDEVIEKQKESLQAEKDLYEYEKSLRDKQNSVAKNALQTSILSLDDSLEGKKAYKQANEEYKNSKSELQDYLYEHELEVREAALDKLKEDTDKTYDEQIDKINEYLNDEVKLYKDACSMIDNDHGTLYNKLLAYCKTYTTTSESEFKHMWQTAQTALQNYNTANYSTFSLIDILQGKIYTVDSAIDTVADSISAYESKIEGVKNKLDSLSDSANTTIDKLNTAMNTEEKFKNREKLWVYEKDGKTYISSQKNKDKAVLEIMDKIATAEPYNGIYPGSISADKTYITNRIKQYAKGTRGSEKELARINEEGQETLFAKTPQGDFAVLQPGTQVFTKEQTDNLFDISKNPDDYFAKFKNGLFSKIDFDALRSNVFKSIGLYNSLPNNTSMQRIGNISPTIQINVQGDATQSTIKALKAEANNIVKKATDNIMNIALRNKKII